SQPDGRASREPVRLPEGVHDAIGPGGLVFVDAVHPEEAQDRPLGRDGGEGLRLALDALGDARREAAAAVDPVLRKAELEVHSRVSIVAGCSRLGPGISVCSEDVRPRGEARVPLAACFLGSRRRRGTTGASAAPFLAFLLLTAA